MYYQFNLTDDSGLVRSGTLYREAEVQVGDNLFQFNEELWQVTAVDAGDAGYDAMVSCCPAP